MSVPIQHRRRVVHGWAFRDHSDLAVEAIREFLGTGMVNALPVEYRGIAALYAV